MGNDAVKLALSILDADFARLGDQVAEAYGRRNSGPGELLVRVKPVKITGEKDIAGW